MYFSYSVFYNIHMTHNTRIQQTKHTHSTLKKTFVNRNTLPSQDKNELSKCKTELVVKEYK